MCRRMAHCPCTINDFSPFWPERGIRGSYGTKASVLTKGLCQTHGIVLSFDSSQDGSLSRGTSSPSETMDEASFVALHPAIQELVDDDN